MAAVFSNKGNNYSFHGLVTPRLLLDIDLKKSFTPLFFFLDRRSHFPVVFLLSDVFARERTLLDSLRLRLQNSFR